MAISSNGDKYFSNVSLLLPFDGANGSTTFYDASPIPKAITTVGNTNISTTQSKFGGSSGYFDGSGDYLELADTTSLQLGTGDFTIECWVYCTANTLYNAFATKGAATDGFFFGTFAGTNQIRVDLNGTTFYTFSSTITLNAWTHVALVRTGTSINVYVNGIKDSYTLTGSEDISTATNPLRIGRGRGSSTNYLTGYVDSLRITKGLARYTTSFTPPTAPFPTDWEDVVDPYYDNVVLHLPMDGPENGTTFVDRSNTPKTVTTTGSSKLVSTQSKFGGRSCYLNSANAGDYLILSDSSDFIFATNFTIECWVNLPNTTNKYTIVSQWTSLGASDSSFALSITNTGKVQFEYAISTTASSITGTSQTITTNTWTHIAVSCNNNTVTLYINGVADTTTGSLSSALNNSTQTVRIGYYTNTSPNYFNGYIDSLRITKDIARYTSNFTVPTGPFAIGKPYIADPYASNVKLLLTGSGANGTQAFRDESGLNNIITVAGNTVVDRNRGRVGGGSIYFDGTGDYLSIPNSSDFSFGTEAFTVEFWVNLNNTSGTQNFWGLTPTNITGIQLIYNWPSAGNLTYSRNNAQSIVSTPNFVANTWYHIALVKATNTMTLFIDGTSVGSISDTLDHTYNTAMGIGTEVGGDTALTIKGYINNLRITKGAARYTANFTPEYSYLLPPLTATTVVGDPYYDNVALLLNFNGSNGATTFKDTSKYNRTLTPTSAEISTAQSKFGGASGHLTATGGRLIVPSNSEINFNGTFTLEFWIYVTAYPATVSYFFGATNNAGNYLALTSAGLLSITSGSTLNIGTISLNQWTHVAITQDATSRFVFKDGTLTASVSAGSTDQSTRDTDIFGLSYNFSNYHLSTAYLDDLRFTRGIARYTSSFTPPTSEFLLAGDYLYDNTVLTLRLDGNYVDSSPKSNTVTAYGNASLSASTYKYGTGSLSLDGVGDYIATPDNVDFRFGTGDFCIECWVNVTTHKAMNAVFDHVTGSSTGWMLYIGNAGNVFFTDSVTTLYSSVTITAATWTHVAVTRNSGNITIWVGGVQACTPTATGSNFTGATTYFGIGALINNRLSLGDFQGYIDNVRITKGAARYTSTFTPADIESPTAAGPVRAYSVQSITSNGAVKFTIPVAGVIQAGFSTNASTDITKNDLEYSIQIDSSKVLTIVEAGVVKATVGTASDGTNFEIEYSGTTMTYKSNGAQLLTTTVTAGMTLYFSAFIEDTGLSVTAIQIGTYAADGTPGNISGQITSSNVSTYIASAAIGSAYINDLTANKITSGTIQASTSITVGDLTNGVVLGNLGSTYGLRGLKAATEVFRLDANGLDSKIKQTALNLFGSSYHCKIVQEGYYIFNQGTGTTQTTTIPIVIDTFSTYRLIFHITGYYENSDFTQSAACMRYGMQGVYFNNNLLKTRGLGNINWISEEAADSTAVGPFNVDRIDLQFDNVMERYNLILQSRMADPAGSTSKFSYIVWAVDNIAYPYAEY